MNDSTIRRINPDGIAKPTGYTHVVETTARRTVYIAGQVAFDVHGGIVGRDDMGAQAEQVFRNLETALAAVGATFADVVKFTYFLTDIAQIPAVREVRNRYIDPAHVPASTAVEVRALFMKELMIEVEAIAVLAD